MPLRPEGIPPVSCRQTPDLNASRVFRRAAHLIRGRGIAAIGVALYFGTAAPAGAQSTEELVRSLRKEIEALKEGQASMRREIQELRDALRAQEARQAPPAPHNIALTLDGAPVRGDGRARLILIDFTDYQ
jgi:hypothetical protein